MNQPVRQQLVIALAVALLSGSVGAAVGAAVTNWYSKKQVAEIRSQQRLDLRTDAEKQNLEELTRFVESLDYLHSNRRETEFVEKCRVFEERMARHEFDSATESKSLERTVIGEDVAILSGAVGYYLNLTGHVNELAIRKDCSQQSLSDAEFVLGSVTSKVADDLRWSVNRTSLADSDNK
jgi:hypothetical protein